MSGRTIDESKLRDEIKNGLTGGYFLWGDEDYLKSHYAAELRRTVLCDESGFGDFNYIALDTDSFDGAALENALASLPMMSDTKLVEMRSPDIGAWRERERNEFVEIISHIDEYPGTVLLVTVNRDGFDAGNPPKRPSPMFKAIGKHMAMVEFPLQTEGKLRKWVLRHLAGEGVGATEDVASYIIGYCGRDMRNLDSELGKLTAYALSHGRNEITQADVEAVCSPGGEDDAFELTNAVVAGDRTRALGALLKHKQRREEPISVMASVSRTVCEMLEVALLSGEGKTKAEIAAALKLHEYKAGLYIRAVSGVEPDRLRAALERCRKTDALLKSTTLGYIAIERFVATIPKGRR